MEAEARDILSSALKSGGRIKLGSLLADIGRDAHIEDDEVDSMLNIRDRIPAEPTNFE